MKRSFLQILIDTKSVNSSRTRSDVAVIITPAGSGEQINQALADKFPDAGGVFDKGVDSWLVKDIGRKTRNIFKELGFFENGQVNDSVA